MVKRVVFIHPDLGIGGAERLMVDCAYTLHLKKIPCCFVVNHHDESHCFPETRDMIPVHVIGDWIPRHIFGVFQAFLAYLRLLYLTVYYVLCMAHKDWPDVAVVDQIPIAVPILRLRGIPVIYYCHHPDLLASPPGGLLKKIYRFPIDWMEQYTTGLANVILVNSKYTRDVFRTTFPRIRSEVRILYPSVIEEQYVSNDKTNSVADLLPNGMDIKDVKVFLSINRFHAAKQLDLAVKAMSCLQNIISDDAWEKVHLVMAGGYDPENKSNRRYYAHLESMIVSMRLDKNVTLLKSPSHENKLKLLCGNDCVIYTPSNEHFGIVPLEAMVVGKPVIAVNSGGPRETVMHSVTGFLCDSTPEDMAYYMSKILESDKKNLDMGEAGLKRFRDNFDFNTFSNKFIGTIEELIASCCAGKTNVQK